jgi:hypothetical protein
MFADTSAFKAMSCAKGGKHENIQNYTSV